MSTTLIISPQSPPINAPDLHHVRLSFPPFEEHRRCPEVWTVPSDRIEPDRNPLLEKTVPPRMDVRTVGAPGPRWTRLVDLGSVALRSLPSYFWRGSRRQARGDVDLVYFSTTASKFYPYILSRRPVPAVCHQRSGAVDILQKTRAGEAVTFDGSMDVGDLVNRVFETLTPRLEGLPYTPNTDWDAFQPYTAGAMTRRQVEVFDRVVSRTSRKPEAPVGSTRSG